MQEKNENKVTNEDIQIAYAFADRYKFYYNWTDDHIQEAMLRFVKNYNPDADCGVETFFKLVIDNVVYGEWRYNTAKKRNGINISVDSRYNNGDEKEWLLGSISNKDEFQFIIDEQIQNRDEYLQQILNELKPIHKYVIEEFYFNGTTLTTLSEELGTTRQNVSDIKRRAINSLRKKINFNKIIG